MSPRRFSKQPCILWLEDNPKMFSIFSEEFSPHYKVHQVNNLSTLQSMPPEELLGFDAILLDLSLPDGKTSAETIQFIRSSGIHTPILILSNDESLKSRLEMLNNGADDYLWKAMHPEEMLLRIRNAILRFQQTQKDSEIKLGGLTMEPSTLNVELNGEEIDLSKIEFQFLMLLIRKFPEPTTTEELRVNIWKIANLESGTINTFIWKMNKKLENWNYRLSKTGESVALQSKV